MEWKVKGDRKTQDRKLSWSFRLGAKLHGNPDITDIYYLSFRRSRLDYRPKVESVFNNSGFEYTVDFERGTFTPIRHYFFVEKKWPVEGKKMAFALATGFVWESADKYSGVLATGRQGSQHPDHPPAERRVLKSRTVGRVMAGQDGMTGIDAGHKTAGLREGDQPLFFLEKNGTLPYDQNATPSVTPASGTSRR